MVKYQIVGNLEEQDDSSVTVYLDGKQYIMSCTHPAYRHVVAALVTGEADDSIVEHFDVGKVVQRRFEAITDRVSVDEDTIYFDGDPVDSSIAKQILRAMNEGNEDYMPLVLFMENVAANPNPHSRTQLWDWLRNHDFTITSEGKIVGYKGVVKKDDGSLRSIHSGKAIVDGVEHTGQIPNYLGAVVTMPRSAVMHDPASSCSTGLHIGTYEYASGYNQGAMLEVHVDPRDVVSVPTDAYGAKIRVCRYEVVRELDAPYQVAVLNIYEKMDDGYVEEWEDEWGDDSDDWYEDDPYESQPSPYNAW